MLGGWLFPEISLSDIQSLCPPLDLMHQTSSAATASWIVAAFRLAEHFAKRLMAPSQCGSSPLRGLVVADRAILHGLVSAQPKTFTVTNSRGHRNWSEKVLSGAAQESVTPPGTQIADPGITGQCTCTSSRSSFDTSAMADA